jgi:hypothetical protein
LGRTATEEVIRVEPLFVVRFKGHPNVRATNRMTLEVTREDFLTLRGDCIVGICADVGCADLPAPAKELLRRNEGRVRLTFSVGERTFELTAWGSSALPLTHPESMVIRRSSYTCSRTVAIRSSAAACDLPREMVKSLASGVAGEMRAYPL